MSRQPDTTALQDDESYPEEEEDLEWAKRPHAAATTTPKLVRPISIPTSAPSIQSPFLRAWSPELTTHDVQYEEFLQFIDHLNVCKAASPALQVLNLAGNAIGFVPFHLAFVASMATSAAAVGGMFAVAKVRITRYLVRANKDYFVPRGLCVQLSKHENLENLLPPSDGPLLRPLSDADRHTPPKLYERRLAALGENIARLEIQDGPPGDERNILDKLTTKSVARSVNKQEKKASKEREKAEEDESKEKRKMEKEIKKIEKDIEKVNISADKDLRKDPDKIAKVEAKRRKELSKLEEEIREAEEEYEEKIGVSEKDADKAAKQFLWIVITGYDPEKEKQQDD